MEEEERGEEGLEGEREWGGREKRRGEKEGEKEAGREGQIHGMTEKCPSGRCLGLMLKVANPKQVTENGQWERDGSKMIQGVGTGGLHLEDERVFVVKERETY